MAKQNSDRFIGGQSKTAGRSSKLARSGNGFKGGSQTPGPRQTPVEGNGFKTSSVKQPKKAARKFGPAG
jgi:hypothetical protein